MTDQKSHPFSFRLTSKERKELDKLAKHTQRSRANVIKLLIKLAWADPETMEKLEGLYIFESKGE